jgi:ribonuclease III
MPLTKDAELEQVLGHTFSNRELLVTALTHPSESGRESYQRLEFLGDRILGALIAEKLYELFPGMNEGSLALRYNEMVRRETLASVAGKMGLAPYIRLSVGEDESGGREKPAILADVCEAVIAALYLDGGLACARRFVFEYWADMVSSAQTTEKDGKTALQEWAQGYGLETPVYREVDRSGPSHEPIFTMEVSLENGLTATGKAGSKRGAETAAASRLMTKIKGHTE